MRRLFALIVLLAFAGLPAVDAAVAAKPKPKSAKSKKLKACERKAKKVKSKRKRKAALKKCAARHGAKKKKRKPVRKPVVPLPVAPATPPYTEGGIGDATVVAVIDGGINPYHFDFRAAKMPQHIDGDPANDLPLDRPFTEWLPGAAGAPLASLERRDLTLPDDPEEQAAGLAGADGQLDKLESSTPDQVHAVWFPGTKIIGAADFLDTPNLWEGVGAHGVGTTSSVVGNLHGTCPECLLFFVNLGDEPTEIEAQIDWVMQQPWIDAISNSYGLSLTPVDRTRVYDGSNTQLQAQASERGQTVFFSAGNGNDGAFVTPNNTTFSSQEGPDWIVTVGAVSPPEGGYYDPLVDPSDSDGRSAPFFGAGKPADVAGVGSDYPTAYTAPAIGGTGAFGFGGTSNATPQVAGLYARALYMARKALGGPSRAQSAGVVASGTPVACGAVRPDCELGDGRLTAAELRTRFFHGAVHSGAGFAIYSQGATQDPTTGEIGEEKFMAEGHGSYLGRVWEDRDEWLPEFDRILGPLTGTGKALERPAGEHEWMVVDSYCRQQNWGAWTQGYYVEGKTELPGPDPAFPARSQREQTCPGGPTPP